MSSGQQICLITSLSNTLLNDYRHLNGLARTFCNRRHDVWRSRHRRVNSAPSTPLKLRRRARGPANQLIPASARRALHSFPKPSLPVVMASGQVRRRGLSMKAASLDAIVAESGSDAGDSTIVYEERAETAAPRTPARTGRSGHTSGDSQTEFTLQPWTSSASSVPRASDTYETRSTRSSSTASRNANRLSLTLPVAPANSLPSRPTPNSIPPTPTESVGSGMASPVDPNDFIVAIAAQERRVLELREELSRAECELKTLKTRWNSSEAHKVRTAIRKRETVRPSVSATDRQTPPESGAARASLDVERKKALLLGNGTPREYKRRVMRGGHTRTLSLLSPTKSEHDIPIHNDIDTLQYPDALRLSQEFTPTPLAQKRATWAPRQSPPPNGVKQIAQDFRHGLWTFVEDLRQATVGDEGISATSNRTSDFQPRLSRTYTDQDTIRPSNIGRGRIPFTPESEGQTEMPRKPSPGSFQDRASHQRSQSKPDGKARKHFSWTPLTFDDLGDDDWSNWDSPNVKTSRWSGSTVNGDIIPAIPEKLDENEATL